MQTMPLQSWDGMMILLLRMLQVKGPGLLKIAGVLNGEEMVISMFHIMTRPALKWEIMKRPMQ